MVSTKPQCDPEGLYCVREVAEILGVCRHTVKRYELSGCIRFAVRKAGRKKVATGKEIIRCWRTTYL